MDIGSELSFFSRGELIACHECDELQRIPAMSPGHTARCRVCKGKLLRNPAGGLERSIALYLTALILLLLSNAFPFLTLEIQGRQEVTTIFGASLALANAGMPELGVAVFITSILAPAMIVAGSLYVLVAARLRLTLPGSRTALSWISFVEPWGMLDVFMLGVLVAFVKLGNMATMHMGPSLFAFCGLIFVAAAAASTFETQILWRQLDRRQDFRDAG